MTGALAIDAEGQLPIPPLVVVLPPFDDRRPSSAGVLGVVLGTVALLAARTYGRATLGERRGGATDRRAGTWTTGPERADG